MSLPEIPQAATDAAREAGYGNAEEIDVTLSAAWPHLYAAALRHAASGLEHAGGNVMDVAQLRVWAEDAAP